eukprot:TRINITY_DN652_c0_g2_i3.p1 TRINITY_DN652_c0_g2~~TRINITY_DN652_c0_g2_i3.p1  ORF type:complete len:237 (-),score=34.44 TRINITY_DN652_c0_g2_i3:76-786(-)
MYPYLKRYSKCWQVNIIAFEYQGYGISDGSPSPGNCKQDEMIIIKFLREILKVPLKFIILFGRSIGTGPASYAAARLEKMQPNSLGGIILQSPYSSIRALAKELVGGIGVLSPNPFDNESCIKKISCPLLLIHGKEDTLITSEHSQTLFDACKSKIKTLHLCEGSDHNTWNEEADVEKPVAKWLHEVYSGGVHRIDEPEIPIELYSPPSTKRSSMFGSMFECVSARQYDDKQKEKI